MTVISAYACGALKPAFRIDLNLSSITTIDGERPIKLVADESSPVRKVFKGKFNKEDKCR